MQSGNVTRGHRRLGKQRDRGRPSTTTKSSCAKNGVILSADERRSGSRTASASCCRQRPDAHRRPRAAQDLVYLTEYPTPILGGFDPQVPRAARRKCWSTVMRHHQRTSPWRTPDGKLAPHFIAVMNTEGRPRRAWSARQRARAARPLQRRPLLLGSRTSRRSWPTACRTWRTSPSRPSSAPTSRRPSASRELRRASSARLR